MVTKSGIVASTVFQLRVRGVLGLETTVPASDVSSLNMSEIEVVKIENPGCFWGIIRKGFGAIPEDAEAYERLYMELNQLYSVTYRDIEEIKPSALEKGQVCAVFSDELKCWCRAIIESFMSSGDDFLAECFLVDYAKYVPVKTKR
ncbi:hypothetical protein NDU88_003018 [Pleurodeles waltl]|uniref:RNA helicase n=1 Tax=Pleurodeles waltl TaxID=8319 RepID=A0AAV7KVC1_PLEWA|nr:hypothetical protein NDU88_003018 [Pleurodeles waltl]